MLLIRENEISMTNQVKPKKRSKKLAKILFANDIDYAKFQNSIDKEALKKAKIRYSQALSDFTCDGEKSFLNKEKQQELIDADREIKEIESKLKRSKTNAKNAANPPKKKPNPTVEEVTAHRDNFYWVNSTYYGWVISACKDLKTTPKTLNSILNKSN